jgi:glycolate oxidase FAD binding subunit
VVTLEVDTPTQAGAAVGPLLRSALEPSAIELDWTDRQLPGRLTVLFEGIEPGVEAQAEACAELLGRVGTAAVAGPGETGAALAELGAWPFEKAEVGVKLTCPPAELPAVLDDLRGGQLRWAGPIHAHAGTGVLWVAGDFAEGELAADGEGVVPALAGAITATRERLTARGGSLVLVKAPTELKRAVDAWGPAGDALGLMRRVKERFDPDRRMSPGRFVGGI